MITSHIPIFTTALGSDQVTPEAAVKYIQLHEKELHHLQRLENYYVGQHDILSRVKRDPNQPNNLIVASYPKYIADFSSAYFMGTPVTYSAKDKTANIDNITAALSDADSPTQDSDLELDASIYGRAYELIYTNEDSELRLARLSPLNAFVVYDETVEQRPVFGVHYYPVFDDNGQITGYKGMIATDTYMQEIRLTNAKTLDSYYEPVAHYFGKVPIDEIYNNGQRFGDFEAVLPEIDAYNKLQSDRVNDKEQFVDALLVIKGAVLGDTDEESAEAYSSLKKNGVMTLNEGADAAYLTRQFDESSVEVLKNSIVDDIHKLSYVPDMTDESFGGNVSGVAMKFKLLMLEGQAKIKERYFAEGLRYRLECINNYLVTSGAASTDIKNIKMTFTRSLPVNLQETAQTASSLTGVVSKRTQLEQLPFVEDVDEELKTIAEEQQAALTRQMQLQQALIMTDMNTNIRDADM